MSASTEHPATTPDSGNPRPDWPRRLIISLTVLAWIAIAGIAFWFIGLIGYPLILMGISLLIAYVLYPLVKLLKRVMPGALAILISYLAVLVGLFLILYYVFWVALTQLISLIQQAQKNLPAMLQRLQPLIDTLKQVGVTPQQFIASGQQFLNEVVHFAGSLLPLAFSLFGLVISCIIITSSSIYFILDGTRILHWLRTKPPHKQRVRIAFFLDTLDKIMGAFLRGQILAATITTIIMGVGLYLIGVPYALLLALVVFIFEFVPQIGSYISAAIVILFAFISRNWQVGIIVAIFSGLVQGGLDGQILIPRILGGAVGLHPVVALFALLVGAVLFGLPGAILAAPIAGIAQIFLTSAWRTWQQTHAEEFLEESSTSQPLTDQPPS